MKKLDKLKKNDNTNNQRIKELEEELEKNKEYFDNNEVNRIETENKIKELNNFNDELNKENRKIKEELDNKEKLISEYVIELNKLNY